eukprot:PITA_04651
MHIRRCVREDEIFDILKACHDGPCGGHFADRRTGHKVLQTGYYWATIFKDAKKFVQACDSCQRAGCPEYVTKLVEVEALPRATEDSVIQFLFHLFVRYGLPREIITDSGPYFSGNKIAATLNNYHVQHKIITPYHPQANEQEVGLDLTEAQINQLQQINELDEIRLSALQNIALIQQQRAKWHDALIKNKVFHEGHWALLYNSRFQDFPGKLQTRWLGPYEIQKVHDNGTLTLITIDASRYAFKANSHRVRLYRKPLTRESFCQQLR